MTDEERQGVNELVGKLNTKEDEIVELEKENDLAKSLLYCTKGTCDNCGFVNCENFQRQRTSNPCALYISYKDRIKHLEKENKELKTRVENQKSFLQRIQAKFNLGEIDRKEIEGYLESEQLIRAKDLIRNLLRVTYGEGWNYSLDWKVKAEAFLKEVEEYEL